METGMIYFIDWDKYQDEYLSSIYRHSNWTLYEFNQITLNYYGYFLIFLFGMLCSLCLCTICPNCYKKDSVKFQVIDRADLTLP